MPDDQKDRFGDTLREAEKAREDLYFAEQDKKLVEKLKAAKQAEAEAELRSAARMRCPKCGQRLSARSFHEVQVEECPDCGGLWLDAGEFEALAKRENEGWLGRLFRSRG